MSEQGKAELRCMTGYLLEPGDLVLIPAVVVAVFTDGRHFNLRVETTGKNVAASTLGLNARHVYLDAPKDSQP